MLYGGFLYLWVVSMEFASCHPSGTCYFEVAPRFLENVCIPGVSIYLFICDTFVMLSVEYVALNNMMVSE